MKIAIRAVAVMGLAALGLCYSRAHAQPPPPQDTTRSIWDGVYTDAQADRGREQYTQHCANCHGDTLMTGDGPSARARRGRFPFQLEWTYRRRPVRKNSHNDAVNQSGIARARRELRYFGLYIQL